MRVTDLDGPFVDFGALDESQVELLEPDDRVGGKIQHHEDVLVCAQCVRRANLLLPGEGGRLAEADGRIRALEVANTQLRALLNEAIPALADKLEVAVAQDDPDPQGVEDEPPPADPSTETGDFGKLTIRQLRQLAKDHRVAIPAALTKQAEIAEFLEEKLTAPEGDQ